MLIPWLDGEPPISLGSLEKGDEQQNDQASLAAVKPEAFDRPASTANQFKRTSIYISRAEAPT